MLLVILTYSLSLNDVIRFMLNNFVAEDPSCPDDYVSYTDGSKCYKLVEISASYDDATAACGRDGARMAMVIAAFKFSVFVFSLSIACLQLIESVN